MSLDRRAGSPEVGRRRAQARRDQALVTEAAENFAYAEPPPGRRARDGDGRSSRRPIVPKRLGLALAPTTVIHKSAVDAADATTTRFRRPPAGAETKTLTVGRGDTLRACSSRPAPSRARPTDIDALQRDFAAGSEIGPGAPLLDRAGAVRHRPDGAGQGLDLRQRQPPRHGSPQPPGRIRGPTEASATTSRPRQLRPAPRSMPRSTTPRPSSTFRPTPSSSCSASTPTTSTSSRRSRRATLRGLLRRRQTTRRGRRAALHLDDHRRPAPQILPLPHP